jgi:type I restriction enzyme M protein
MKLPKWLEEKYDLLWDKFEDREFRSSEALEILGREHLIDEKSLLAAISEMRKNGWIETRKDPNDERRRIYRLRPKSEIIKDYLTLRDNKLGRADIERILKRAADLIRTRVDYKFILVLLFMKQVSDKWRMEYQKAYEDAIKEYGLSEEEARVEARNSAYHDLDINEEYLWDNIRNDVENMPDKFGRALKNLAELNPAFKDVVDAFDFLEFTQRKENREILRQLVELFSEKKLTNVDPDILGDAYEWILRYFAPTKAKEGEVYTPREVIRLLVEILDPKPGESVYDPASASNGMLIISHRYVKETYGDVERLFLYGQEVNRKTMALGSMNMYIHDIKDYNIAHGDTLLYPKFKESDGIMRFDVVIANPPWNQDGYGEDTLKKGEYWRERFKYGFVTKQSADWAWIQHMIASAKDDGRIGVVIDNGCLFRGGRERSIRSAVLEDDLIEAVILLPEKLFYNTGAPGAIIILNKDKDEERRGKVLFINAGEEYEKHPEVRKLNILSDENIARILEAYREFRDDDGFSRVVNLEEIRENDYNLNVPLYAFPEEELEDVDVAGEWRRLSEIEDELAELDERIMGYLDELGYMGVRM